MSVGHKLASLRNNRKRKTEIGDPSQESSDWATYKRLLSYVAPYWYLLVLSIVGFLAAAGAEAYFARLLGELIDEWETIDSSNIAVIPLSMLAAASVRALGTVFGESLIARISFNVVFNLRDALFNKTLTLPSAYFDANTQGHVVSRVTFTVAQLRDTGTDALRSLFQDGLKIIVYLGAMLWIDWQLTLLFFATMPLLALVVVFASSRFRRISRRIQNSMGDVTHVVSEAVSGYRVVRTFGGQEYEHARFNRFSRVNRQQNLKMAITKVNSAQLNELIISVALCILIALLSDRNTEMSPGDAVAFLGLAGLLGRPIKKLSEVNAKLQRGLAAAEDVFTQLDENSECNDGREELGTVEGSVAFEQVTFRYENDKVVLNNINLHIEAGQTVALVGRSGSGKTTLASLIPRFYEIDSGRICIDGCDIRSIDLKELRKHIALVSQQVTLFNDTLRNNIAYGDLADRSEAEILSAIKQAHADVFIGDLSEGLDTVVGDDGVLLSGGQRQRVAIARALLKDAPILILDEATSALDNESERHIQFALDAVMEGRTTIVIAHRLSTVESADVILVMENGAIVESGQHQALINAGGHYGELYQAQFQDDRPVSSSGKLSKNEGMTFGASLARVESFEKSALGLSQAWYQDAWWLSLFIPLSWIYDIARKRRQKKLTKVGNPGRTRLPVIVVGNITVGGTGKTPVVAWLVETLREMGFSPGIVMRGYGGQLSKEGTLIPSAADPERYSDEGVQMRDRLGCPVAMCADRVKGLRMLETQACDIAISDDGLQHYAMARDIEIAVVDGTRGVGNGRLLPAGPLREPVSRLSEVDWVISNGEASNLVPNESVMKLRADGFVNVASNEWLTPEEFIGLHQNVHAVCGIGNPGRFFTTLHQLGLGVAQHVYRDHHDYKGEEVIFADETPVVCTEKDAAKLKNLEQQFSQVWFLSVSVELPRDALLRLQALLEHQAIRPQQDLST